LAGVAPVVMPGLLHQADFPVIPFRAGMQRDRQPERHLGAAVYLPNFAA